MSPFISIRSAGDLLGQAAPMGIGRSTFWTTLGLSSCYLCRKPLMKYSIRTLALGFFILALLLALFFSNAERNRLEEKLHSLVHSHGLYTQNFGDGDVVNWELVPIGQQNSLLPSDTFLLRIRDYQKYNIRVHFIKGSSGQYTSEVFRTFFDNDSNSLSARSECDLFARHYDRLQLAYLSGRRPGEFFLRKPTSW